MSGLFKKLNTLVRATINDAIDISSGRSVEIKPGAKLDKEIKRLRGRINEAIDYEDKLEARVQALQREIEDLDLAADEAVRNSKDETARELIKQMQARQRELGFAEADLRAHRRVAEELIRQVNMMEAAVADTKHEERTTDTPEPAKKRVTIPVDRGTSTVPESDSETGDIPEQARTPVERINEAFSQAQSSIGKLRDRLNTTPEPDASGLSTPEASPSKVEQNIDDDLTARRSRLTKPPKE